MKIQTHPQYFALILGLTLCKASIADQQSGALAAAPGSKANWIIGCEPEGSVASARLAFQIEGLTKGRKFTVKATAQKDGVIASTVDLKAADKKPSAYGYDIAGDGAYLVTIEKVVLVGPQTTTKLKGNMLYSLTAHCESSNGIHTRTVIQRG